MNCKSTIFATAALLLAAVPVSAEDKFPSKPIRMLVPFSAGEPLLKGEIFSAASVSPLCSGLANIVCMKTI